MDVSAFADCSICSRAPKSGDGSCPFKDTLYRDLAEEGRHGCLSFKPVSNRCLEKRGRVEVEQESLF